MSQQSLMQASIRTVTGTAYTYEGDWHALWDNDGIAAGQFNERMILWINVRLGASHTEVNGAMAALADSEGADSFQSIGTFDAAVGGGGSPPLAPLFTLDSITADIPSFLIDYVGPAINDEVELQRSTDNFATYDSYMGDTAILSLSPVTTVTFTTGAWAVGAWKARVRLVRSGVNGAWSNEASVTITAAADQFYSGVHLTGGAQFYDGIHAGA